MSSLCFLVASREAYFTSLSPDATRDASCHLAARFVASLAERAPSHGHAHSTFHPRRGRETARRSGNKRREDVAHVGEIRFDGGVPDREIVPELRERLVGVAHTSHMEQQAHIEDISDLALRQAHLARQAVPIRHERNAVSTGRPYPKSDTIERPPRRSASRSRSLINRLTPATGFTHAVAVPWPGRRVETTLTYITAGRSYDAGGVLTKFSVAVP